MLILNFSSFPNLETDRLLLRRLNKSDASDILKLRGDAENMKFIPRPLSKTEDDALEHLAMIDDKIENNERINWAITLKLSNEFVGIIGHYRIKAESFRAEIGYMILREFQGIGIATEAIKIVLNYGFDTVKLHSVEAIIDPQNYASEKILQKNGFVKEAHLVENEFYDGKFLDTVIYSLLKKNRLI
jgi:ribosomal-protein-alanine N-acetyltransferase